MRYILTLMLTLGLSDVASANATDWYVVNDTVMGGVSSSEVVDGGKGSVIFRGELSLENNGGFTSTRTEAIPDDWTGVTGMKFRVVGDGRSYIATIRVRTRNMRRIYYRQAFDTTAGVKQEIDLPLANFSAYAYGQRVPSAPPVQMVLNQIGSVGVMLADKQPGDFELRIDDISTYNDGSPQAAAPMFTGMTVTDLLQVAISEGVPLYNAGEPDRCADIYRTALISVMMLAPDQLTEEQLTALATTVRSSQMVESDDERAWALRRAIDWLAMTLNEKG